MAIVDNLRKILESRYGKDVRQAIHDAIHDCYEDGRSGATDLIAREMIQRVPQDVKVVGNSVISDGEADIPQATSTVFGVIKLGNGAEATTSGFLRAKNYTLQNYEAQNNNTFISKGTLENVLKDRCDDVFKTLIYQSGEIVEIQKGAGGFVGYLFGANQLRLVVPMEKIMTKTPAVDTRGFALNIYSVNGTQNITTEPTSVSVIRVSGTNQLQLSVNYPEGILTNIAKEFSWRFNNVGDNYLKFVF